jgi:glycosyltransferase involved in cell wall biosynthesis
MEDNLIIEESVVSIVTPISGIDTDLTNIRFWLAQTQNLPIETIIIHDEIDPKLQVRLENMMSELNNARITLHRGHFGSPGAARNKGLEFVHTERVVFWDSDDIGEPRNLIRVIKDNQDSQIIVGSFTLNSDFCLSAQTITLSDEEKSRDFQLGIYPGIWRYIFNWQIIKSLRFSESKMGEDQQFLIEVQLIPKLVRVVDTVLYNYFTGNPTHLTSQKSAKAEVFYSFKKIHTIFLDRRGKMSLFETTVYIKLLWSTLKFSGKFKSMSAIISSLRLILIARRMLSRHLMRIIFFSFNRWRGSDNEIR